MYFEGCLGLNKIQQSGLMSTVFAGDPSLLLRITASASPPNRPDAFSRTELWVLIWTWIIGYLPPLTFGTCTTSPTPRSWLSQEVMGECRERSRPTRMPTDMYARVRVRVCPRWCECTASMEMNLSPLPDKNLFDFTNYEMVKHSARVSLLHSSRVEPSRAKPAPRGRGPSAGSEMKLVN